MKSVENIMKFMLNDSVQTLGFSYGKKLPNNISHIKEGEIEWITPLRRIWRAVRCFNNLEKKITVMDNLKKDLRKIEHESELDASIEILSDEEVIDLLNRDYRNYIYSIIYSKFKISGLSVEDVDDCFIDIIIKLSERGCRRIRQFKGASSFKTYLTVLCRNLATDYIRKEIRIRNKQKQVVINDDDIDCKDIISYDKYLQENPEVRYLEKEKRKMLKQAEDIIRQKISELPPEEKLLISLRMEKNLSYREIDEFLHIDNSRYRLSRIFQKIRDAIDLNMKQSIEELISEEDYEYS